MPILRELQNHKKFGGVVAGVSRDVVFAECWIADVRSPPSSRSKVIC